MVYLSSVGFYEGRHSKSASLLTLVMEDIFVVGEDDSIGDWSYKDLKAFLMFLDEHFDRFVYP